MVLKAFELLESTPKEINRFKKVPFENEKEEYDFVLNSEEENAFYETLVEGWDDKRFLWYENDKKAYCLYVMRNDEDKIEFYYKDMLILWVDEDGENEYDSLDDGYMFCDTFEDVVNVFLGFIERM